jgi:Tfp pilus assembly protein PilX
MIDSIEKNTFKERGALVVTALVIMVALLILGSLTTMIVVAERNISRNHKMAKCVFYLADGGYPLAVTVIENITRGTGAPYPDFTIEENLKNEVMDYHQDNTSLNDKHLDSPRNAPDIKGTLWGQVVRIDIDRTHTALVYGGSAEFASGGEGIGFGGGASKKLLFEITTEGSLQESACAKVVTVYRSVL